MLNKRILIKNLLSHNDENTFYDKKESIDLSSNTGKGKLLKHICALSNSNPDNNSYLIIGIANETNEIKGFSFVDDSLIQNLVNAYLTDPPLIRYENIYFPNLPRDKVIGLLTISPKENSTSFKKSIGKVSFATFYYRLGSNSIPYDEHYAVDPTNSLTVSEIEKFSKISLQELLDDIFDFHRMWHKDYNPQYKVFKDQFVVCWSGYRSEFYGIPILNEVDIRIVNEAIKIFYSAVKWIDIIITDSDFIIIEFVVLGFDDNYKLYPFEKTSICFYDNGQYDIKTVVIFEPPKFDRREIQNLYERSKELENKLISGLRPEDGLDFAFIEGIANYFLICYLNGIKEAKSDLINSSRYLDGAASECQSDCIRILETLERLE